MKNRKALIEISNSILPVFLAFVIGGFIIAAIGENPFYTYWILIKKIAFNTKRIC